MNEREDSTPRVFFEKKTYGELLEIVKDNPHASITVKGHINVRNVRNEDKTWHKDVRLVADFVEKSKTQIEQLFPDEDAIGKFWNPMNVSIIIKGIVKDVVEYSNPNGDEWIRYIVQIKDDARQIISASTRKPDRVENFEKGDTIFLSCGIKAKDVEKNGQRQHIENILIRDIGRRKSLSI